MTQPSLPGNDYRSVEAAEVLEGSSTFQDLGLARRGEGPLAASWWAPGRAGRANRSQLLRTALTQLWDNALRATRATGGPGLDSQAALGAVGSLGRSEIGPLSDLDLVVIYEGHQWSQARREDLARALWYPIWDAGFDLDQSIRSLAECRRIASEDLPAASGLLSLRLLAGAPSLAERAGSAVLADWRAVARKRLGELVDSVEKREQSFGHLAFRLEPDLKEARGGLRDSVMLDALVASWLADKPHAEATLARSVEYLLDVRDALHSVARRSTSLLLMADQDQTARLVDPYLTADQLMGNLASSGRALTYALDTTVRRAQSNLPGRKALPAVFVRGRRQGPRLAPLAKGLAELSGEIVFASPSAPLDDAVLPLRAARLAAETGLPLEPLTAAGLRRSPALPEPWPDEARTELAAYLLSGPRVIPVWETLDQVGVIVSLWPVWTAVRNQAQRNALHRHTVDRHQVEAVAGLASLDVGSARRELVAVATLFHDLGKRPGEKDHAALGALLVVPLLKTMGYSDYEVSFMATLVRHHLLLGRLITQADPAASEAVDVLLEAVLHRLDLLDGLAALTEADARAAGPKAWTKQRADLVGRLVANARRRLA